MLLNTIIILPAAFWVVLILLAGGVFWAVGQLHNGLGLPVIVVLATVATWYVIDVFYNDYLHTYALEFSLWVLDEAWWEVALFLAAFLFLAPRVHQGINRRSLHRSSRIFQLVKGGWDQPQIQWGLERMLWGCLIVWAVLSLVAVFRLQDQVLYYFCPYLSYLADPWQRDRIGAGLDFLWTIALHFQMFIAAIFGVILALAKSPRLRALALFGVLTAWPYLVFGRTRNYMLAAVVPGILAWVFLRLRTHIVIKIAVLAVLFALVSAWFNFVMANRSDMEIATAFSQEGFNLQKNSDIHQEGLNMFEELCWINTFIGDGIYTPNGGQRYLAEIVNPIPRTIWPGKPLIGIDYAILRGQSFDGAEASSAGVGATISTGMIGQGVVNFGRLLGPVFAAFLMSLWVAILARLDLFGEELGRIPLYGLGLILTFNLGRDITFLTLYTFIFGSVLVWLVGRSGAWESPKARIIPRSQTREKAPVPSETVGETSSDSSPSHDENPAPLSSPSASSVGPR
jgi:hypothetical protein